MLSLKLRNCFLADLEFGFMLLANLKSLRFNFDQLFEFLMVFDIDDLFFLINGRLKLILSFFRYPS